MNLHYKTSQFPMNAQLTESQAKQLLNNLPLLTKLRLSLTNSVHLKEARAQGYNLQIWLVSKLGKLHFTYPKGYDEVVG